MITEIHKKDVSASLDDIYAMGEVLGRGAIAMVRHATRRSDGAEVALKIVRTTEDEVISIAIAEYALLRRLQHPNIVRAIDFCVVGECAVLTMPAFSRCNLEAAMRQADRNCLSEAAARELVILLLQALDYLHRQDIIHCDVKPENVLVDANFSSLQLIDFNIARCIPEEGALPPNNRPLCAAPEVRSGASPSKSSDIWGAGLCLCLMLHGQCRHDDIKNGTVFNTICGVSEECMQVLRQCLTTQYSMRPSATTLLQSPWLRPVSESSTVCVAASLESSKELLRQQTASTDDSSIERQTEVSEETNTGDEENLPWLT
jgi:serine/threonine protein kinase